MIHKERTFDEKELTDLIKEGAAINFIAMRNAAKLWNVKFTYNKYRRKEVSKLRAKRGQVREFLRLNGVQKWMEKVGVEKFTVVL